MRRRYFIAGLGSATLASPLATWAQQPERIRRIGALMLYAENNAAGQGRSVVFRQELEKLGWTVDRNLTIDFHWGVGDDDWKRAAAAQVLARAPDLVLANGGASVRPMQQATHTVPIIFIGGGDPVACH
jgi:putative ABC transport system substrate-binding protein